MTNESSSNRSGRRGLTIGIAGGLLAGTAAGLVFGVPGLTSASSDSGVTAALVQQTDEPDPATDPAADPAEAPPEMGSRLREALQPLVDDETITAEQADAVVTQLMENRPDRGEFGEGHGPGGRHGGPGMFGRGMDAAVLTDLLGLDPQELMTQLRDGKTLAEIATEQNVDPQAVIDALVAEATTRLDQAVTDGRIDQAEADQKLADATTRITDMVNNGRPDRHQDADDDTTDQPD
jgi:hypothetical protein